MSEDVVLGSIDVGTLSYTLKLCGEGLMGRD